MNNMDKESFCTFMACLFSPPDDNFLHMIRQSETSFFLEDYVRYWGGSPDLLSEFKPRCSARAFLEILRREYRRLFPGVPGAKRSMAHSLQSYWVSNAAFLSRPGGGKGLRREGSAFEFAAVYRQASPKNPKGRSVSADHLVVELEFLSFLYQAGTDEQIRKYLLTHLDEVPELREEFTRFHAHPFYQKAVEILDLFLKAERKRLAGPSRISKSAH